MSSPFFIYLLFFILFAVILTIYSISSSSVSAKLITSVTAEFADLNADHFNASTILVGDSDKIEIDSENYLTKHEHGFEITSEGPTKFVTSGLRTGLVVGKNDALSFNVYTADYLGQQSSILDTNVYLETPTQTETYLLQSTTERVNYGPNTYKFQGEPESGVITIENLKEWRRANLNAGNINSYSLTLKTSAVCNQHMHFAYEIKGKPPFLHRSLLPHRRSPNCIDLPCDHTCL